MVSEKKDALVVNMKNARAEIKKKVEKQILKEYQEAQANGKYPWEGFWLSPHDIDKLQEKLRERDKIVFIEIIAFFSLWVLFSYGLYRLMKMFLLPR